MIDPIFSATSAAVDSSQKKTVLSQDEFFKIMITELTHQDPLEPMDNSDFLNQITQMQTLETMTKLSEGIQSLVLGQQLSSAGSLIGLLVTGVDSQGVEVHGEVERVIIQGEKVILGLENGSSVPLNQVLQVNANDEPEG